MRPPLRRPNSSSALLEGRLPRTAARRSAATARTRASDDGGRFGSCGGALDGSGSRGTPEWCRQSECRLHLVSMHPRLGRPEHWRRKVLVRRAARAPHLEQKAYGCPLKAARIMTCPKASAASSTPSRLGLQASVSRWVATIFEPATVKQTAQRNLPRPKGLHRWRTTTSTAGAATPRPRFGERPGGRPSFGQRGNIFIARTATSRRCRSLRPMSSGS